MSETHSQMIFEQKVHQLIENQYSHNQQTPRILIASMRKMHLEAFRSPEFEFEDLICQLDHVDILLPQFDYSRSQKTKKRLANYLALKTNRKELLNSGCIPTKVSKNYDLFFFICQGCWDITTINSIQGWRNQCQKSVAWVDEIWIKELSDRKTKLCVELLQSFDYIFTPHNESAKAVANLTNRPCYSLAYGIDAIKFCPFPNPKPRNIDIYSIGRRSPIVHQSLLKFAEDKNLLYLHDTLKGLHMNNYKEHRHLYSNLIKRSRYFISNKAKFDTPEQTDGQEELGSRFFEGAASGAVMIGIPPKCETFATHFNWTDSVIPICYDTNNLGELITELDQQPERLEQIRKHNVVNSLLRHDWVYRWEQILETVGIDPTPTILSRKNQLQNLAELVGCMKFSADLQLI
ncbi:glycosyltransferase [Calothrix sp. UHCC 0171]|uniref:glycosyltransferase n=1 Tax=Calothrix sp. UHCC 0171 TaxID=3110245 RepID=UPI002B1F33C8|nr:glycosyltransferase [Calothrix sp. UHCC 0171]MEA5570619.1 glycosyltransferase [Calothrix sp. UHCC 0171]